MIDRNLGNMERVIRLLMGAALLVFTLFQPSLNWVDVFVGVVALSLVLNGIFSRCYLWYVLDINTAKGKGRDC